MAMNRLRAPVRICVVQVAKAVPGGRAMTGGLIVLALLMLAALGNAFAAGFR